MGFTLGEKLERGAMLPEGEYPVVMANWTKAEASSGSPMIKVTWEVTEGDYVGARIFDNFVVTDRGIFRACLALKALGVPEDTHFEYSDPRAQGRERAQNRGQAPERVSGSDIC